jgi:short-subunit dehydrogenase
MSGQNQAPSGKPAIVVTGASSGIGLEIARAAARDSQPIVLVARSRAALDALAAELKTAGAEAVALPLDLTAPGAGAAIESDLAARGLVCDVLVNNAGFGLAGRAAELPRAEQMRLLDLNIRALTDLTLRFLPGMVGRRRGGILNVGSIAGYTPGPNMAAYHASKAFVRSFSSALASEVSGTGVTVTCLAPGFVRTPFLDHLPIKQSRVFKAMPRADAAFTAQAGWRGFRAGKRLVIPRLIDRISAGLLVLLPSRIVPAISTDQPDRDQKH